MPIAPKEFKIGLLVTALLEDKYNKTGHIREEARRIADRYAQRLSALGRVIHPGFFEYEHEAVRAARALKAEAVDVVVLVELAYQKGLIALRALLELEAPLIIWNTQLVEEFAEDADFDLIMVNSGMAGLPEVTSGLVRAGRDFSIVTGGIDDPEAMQQLQEHILAARAAARLKNARVGIIGHPYEGMTDLMQDNFAVMQTFGCTCWPIDHDDVTAAFERIGDGEAREAIEAERKKGRAVEVEEAVMLRSARLALALERVVREGGYDAVAEFDQVWLDDPRIGIIPFFGTSRLTESHVPFTCEADVLRAIAMLVLEEVAGHSTFLEHYILDYRRDRMFDSHDGHGNPALADPQRGVRIVPTIYYKGVHGFGASFNYAYRPGEVTLLSLGSVGEDGFQLISSEGRFLDMQPRNIAAPQTFFQWEGGSIRDFAEQWLYAAPSHHHTAAYGRLNAVLERVADLLGVGHIVI